MAKGAGGGIKVEQEKPKPKPPAQREFLKRKSTQVTVPPAKKAEKSYRYYTDNFEKDKKKAATSVDRSSPAASKQAATLMPPGIKKSNVRMDSGQKPDFNQWSQMNEEQDEPKGSRSPSNPPKAPKPFLARGSGKAGGVGKNTTSKTPIRQSNKQPAQDYNNSLNQEYMYDQSDHQKAMDDHQRALDDFKSLEERAREQSTKIQNTYLNNQKKNQKLFDDDDSEEDVAQPV